MKRKRKTQKDITFKRILQNNIYALKLLLKASPGMVVWNILTSVIGTTLSMANLFFLRYAINSAQNNGSYAEAVTYLVILCAIYILYNVFYGFLNAKLQPCFSYKMDKKTKRMAMMKTTECELACYENPEFYHKYTLAMAQCSGRSEAVLQSMSELISSVVSFFSAGILAMLIDPVVLIFALFPFLMTLIRKNRNKINYETNEITAELIRRKWYSVRTFYQNDYAKEMRLTNISKPLIKRFKDAVDESVKVYKTYGMRLALSWFFEMFAGHVLSRYLVYLYAAWQTLGTGNMQYGDCVVVAETVEEVFDSIDSIISNCMSFHEHALFIENLRYFMDYKPTISKNENGPKADAGDIVLENVSFRYEGADFDVLKNISIKIGKGEKIALVGHNGAGKTTLTKLLLRLYDPTSGNITLDGVDIRSLNLQSYRDMYATVLQDYRHFSMSVKENVLLKRDDGGNDQIVIDSLKKAGVWDRVEDMPYGINTVLDREFDQEGEVLSGGQAQKISIAHIYAKQSPIVILDEPSSALDPIAEYDMYANMMKACENRSMIFISHRLSSAVMADRIYLLDHGEVLEEGSHKELMRMNGKYAEMFRVQAENYVSSEKA